MNPIYENYLGGWGNKVDQELKFLLCVRKTASGEPVAALVRSDASDELHDVVVIGDNPVEISLLTRGDITKIAITRLEHMTRGEWVSKL